MKSNELHSVWSAPDNTRLTAKQFSFRLPVHVAAKLAAISEMYPHKTRTQIVGDLLSTAIEEWASNLPSVRGPKVGRVDAPGETPAISYEEVGPVAAFQRLTNTHYQELERDLGNDAPSDLYAAQLCVVEEMTQEEVDGDAGEHWEQRQ